MKLPQLKPRPTPRSTHPTRPGAVIVITLLALVLLAGLIFYVFNTGRSVQQRIVVQNAADTTVAAGAGWVARSFNTVAMDNTSSVTLLALTNMLDAMPQALDYTMKDQTALEAAIKQQLIYGVNGHWVQKAMKEMREEVQFEIFILQPIDFLFNHSGYDVRTLTYYDGPNGRGEIWRAIESLDALSATTLQNLGPLAQLNARGGGLANLQDGPTALSKDALLLPVLPNIPWKRYTFQDWKRPLLEGLLPEWVDEKQTNRGPYDAVFGWRDPIYKTVGGNQGSHGGSGQKGGTKRIPFSRGGGGPSDGGGSTGGKRIYTGYRVHGPFQWMLDVMGNLTHDHLWHTRLKHFHDPHDHLSNTAAAGRGFWVDTLAHIKLEYMWGDPSIQSVIDPDWEISYPKCQAIAEKAQKSGKPNLIRETTYVAVEVWSLYPPGHPLFMNNGTWRYLGDSQDFAEDEPDTPRVVRLPEWEDMEKYEKYPEVKKLGPHQWRTWWDEYVLYDNAMGLPPKYDPQTGEPIPYRLWRIDDYMFAGGNLGEDAQVRNPHNFSSKDDLPAPYDFNHSQVKPNDATRRELLTFLGIARKENTAAIWPAKFDRTQTYPITVAVAQARVFNNHSFDLWTQMWHSQLEPVQEFPGWVNIMDQTLGDLDTLPNTDSEGMKQLQKYLRSVEDLADPMLTH